MGSYNYIYMYKGRGWSETWYSPALSTTMLSIRIMVTTLFIFKVDIEAGPYMDLQYIQ